MDNQFDLILSDKNNKISQLKLIIENYKNDNVAVSGNNESNSIEIQQLASRIIGNEILSNSLIIVSSYVPGGYRGLGGDGKIENKDLSFFESNKLIKTR